MLSFLRSPWILPLISSFSTAWLPLLLRLVDSESFIFHVTLFFLATLGFIVLFRLPRGIALTSGALDTYSVVFHIDPLGQPLVLDASFELHIQHVVWLLSHPPQHPRDLHMMLLLMSHIRLRIINKRSSESTPWDVQ